MKRPRHFKLRLAAGFSLLLAAAVIVLWVRSNRSTFYFASIARGNARFTLKCSQGELTLAGPPREDFSDPIAADLVARMSNDDFVWKGRVLRRGVWHAWVQAKEGSPTSLLFRRFGYKKTTDPGMAMAYRQWAAALEDPRRYLSAHLLFLISYDHWREASSDWEGPYLLIPLDAAGKPQMPDQKQALHRWHDQVDVVAWRFSLAWLLAATAVLPLMWLSRPRPVRGIALRWAFNLGALLSAIVLLASITGWIRSRFVAETWRFPVRDGPRLTSSDGTAYVTFLFRYVASERGRLQWYERSLPEPTRISPRGLNSSYLAPTYRKTSVSRSGIVAPPGKTHWYVPGIQIDDTPPQPIPPRTVSQPIMSNPASVELPRVPLGPPDLRTPPTWSSMNAAAARTPLPITQTIYFAGSFTPGSRSVVISWWLLALLFAILPCVWTLSTWRRWSRIRAQGGEHLCPVCFYDLRATPDRCPECGTVIAAHATSV